MMNLKRNTAVALLLLVFMLHLPGTIMVAQELKTMSDTLKSIIVTADSIKSRPAGLVKIDAASSRRMVTAMGEGDVIKYIQTLPGISAGVESSSSFYVRGGNVGNNVVTLDGVRLYGYGHLLGITSVFPNTIVGDVDFNVGGFSAESSNMLASHIAVHTTDGNFSKAQGEASVSNFIVGAYATAPIIEDKVAFVAAARVSPLQLEYAAGKSLLKKNTDLFNDVKASVYDLFGKVTYKVNDRHKVFGEVFYSMDKFGYGNAKGTSYDRMEWNNFIGNLHWSWNIDRRSSVKAWLSYNSYGSNQNQEKMMANAYNRLGVESEIKETVAHLQYDYRWGRGLQLKLGAKRTGSDFAPGSSRIYGESGTSSIQNNGNITGNLLVTAYGELEYRKGDVGHVMVAIRGNRFSTEERGLYWKRDYKVSNPEISVSASARVLKWMGLEATYDNLCQYYHTLEGIPLGWSLDMIVPSSKTMAPENSVQYYAGMYFKFKKHRLSAGGYYKELEDIVYFSEATEFFGSQLVSWKNFIELGTGTSKGIEILYEKGGEKLNYKIAYTWSKTDRTFSGVNDGKTFLAKYDRPHVLNVQGDYLFLKESGRVMGANLLFTFQSGNMESTKSATYLGVLPGWGEDIVLDYYSGINNLRLKDYIRLDLGWYAKFKKARVTHNVKAGIYNVLNRHNHFSLFYDNEDREWKQVYIYPIMPSLSYSIEF